MAETLGMLCDKLTIVKLKQFHTDDLKKNDILKTQAAQLQQEIDEYVFDAVSGNIAPEKLTFVSNKVTNSFKNNEARIEGSFGEIFYKLADTNCLLWHEQEKVYEFENVAPEQKNTVISMLAHLNLERNRCIDAINENFKSLLKK